MEWIKSDSGSQGEILISNCGNYVKKVFRDYDEFLTENEYLNKAMPFNFTPVIIFTDSNYQSIIMDKMKGSLIDDDYAIMSDISILESLLRRVLEMNIQLLSKGINHGDLHFGNILYHPKTDTISFIDFGYATNWKPETGSDAASNYRKTYPFVISELQDHEDYEVTDISYMTIRKYGDLCNRLEEYHIRLLGNLIKEMESGK